MAGQLPMQMFPGMLELVNQHAAAAVAAGAIGAGGAIGASGAGGAAVAGTGTGTGGTASAAPMSPPATPVSGSPVMGKAAANAPDAMVAAAAVAIGARTTDEVPQSPRSGMAMLLAAAGVE